MRSTRDRSRSPPRGVAVQGQSELVRSLPRGCIRWAGIVVAFVVEHRRALVAHLGHRLYPLFVPLVNLQVLLQLRVPQIAARFIYARAGYSSDSDAAEDSDTDIFGDSP